MKNKEAKYLIWLNKQINRFDIKWMKTHRKYADKNGNIKHNSEPDLELRYYMALMCTYIIAREKFKEMFKIE